MEIKRSGTGNETIRNYKNKIKIHKNKCYDAKLNITKKQKMISNKINTQQKDTKQNGMKRR